jgi:amphi-Trp domain-containing protein
MADSTGVSIASQYEFELAAGREEIAEVLNGVVDGILTGAIRLGAGADAVSVGVPDDLSLEIEFEDEEDEVSLELELEWPAPDDDSTAPSIEDRPGGAAEEPTSVSAADGSEAMARFEVFRDRGEQWRWRLRHRNGDIIAVSGEGYTRKHNAQKGLRSVKENSPAAETTEKPTN